MCSRTLKRPENEGKRQVLALQASNAPNLSLILKLSRIARTKSDLSSCLKLIEGDDDKGMLSGLPALAVAEIKMSAIGRKSIMLLRKEEKSAPVQHSHPVV